MIASIKGLLKKIYLKFNVIYKRRFSNCELGIKNIIHRNVHINSCIFGNYNSIYPGARLFHVNIGDFSYVANRSRLSNLSIGKFTSIGPEVIAGLGKHPSKNYVSTHPAFYSLRHPVEMTFADSTSFNEHEKIEIGNDVWIGARAIILDGVIIGNGVIVAAGSVVTKDIPCYAVVAGVPAKILRYRFKPHEIEQLEKLKWWDQDINWLKSNVEKFHDINDFYQTFFPLENQND